MQHISKPIKDFYMQLENELSTQNILALFETNKEQRKSFVNDIMQRLDDGEANPMVVHLQVKAMEDILTQLTSTDEKKNKNIEAAKRYKQHLADAFKTYANGAKSTDFHNAKFTQMETGSRYHYDKCGDPVIADLLNQQNELNAKIKEREKFLQAIPLSGMNVLDESTGEMVMIYPPYKTSTTTISVTLK